MNRASAPIRSMRFQVYDDVPVERHEWAKLTLRAHLIKLEREGRISERSGVFRTERG